MEEFSYEKKAKAERDRALEVADTVLNRYNNAREELLYGDYEINTVSPIYSKFIKKVESQKLSGLADRNSYENQTQILQEALTEFLNGCIDLADHEDIYYTNEGDFGLANPFYQAFRDSLEDAAKTLSGTPAEKQIQSLLEEHFKKREERTVQEILESVHKEETPEKKDEWFTALQSVLNAAGRTDEYLPLLYEEMARDRSFCQLQIEKAQDKVENYLKVNLIIVSPIEGEEQRRIRENAVIIGVGQRFLAEMDNAAAFHSRKLDEPMRDLFLPNPAFLDDGDTLPSPEHPERREAVGIRSEDRRNHLRNLVECVKQTVQDTLDKSAPKTEGMLLTDQVQAFARMVHGKYGEEALENRQGSPELRALREAGSNHVLDISNDDRKALSGKGSNEYTRMRCAYDLYLADGRIPGKDCTASIQTARLYAKNYLDRKDTIPFTTEGKKRVEAAAQIFTKAALHELSTGDPKSREDVLSQLQTEMLRNPTCRRLVEESPLMHSDSVREDPGLRGLFLFARACDKFAAAHGCKGGVILPGKLVTGRQAADDALEIRMLSAVNDITKRLVPENKEKNFSEEVQRMKDELREKKVPDRNMAPARQEPQAAGPRA